MIALLVADDEHLRHVLEMAMPPEFELRACGTPVEAMSRLDGGAFDVLLVDLDVKGGGGERLVHTARTLLRPPATIVMSVRPERFDACVGIAHAFVAKPFMLTTVRAAVRRAAVRAGFTASRN